MSHSFFIAKAQCKPIGIGSTHNTLMKVHFLTFLYYRRKKSNQKSLLSQNGDFCWTLGRAKKEILARFIATHLKSCCCCNCLHCMRGGHDFGNLLMDFPSPKSSLKTPQASTNTMNVSWYLFSADLPHWNVVVPISLVKNARVISYFTTILEKMLKNAKWCLKFCLVT